jgi:hypothetical protein
MCKDAKQIKKQGTFVIYLMFVQRDCSAVVHMLPPFSGLKYKCLNLRSPVVKMKDAI